jgi:U3 small nucleolar RNA-associated protein 14
MKYTSRHEKITDKKTEHQKTKHAMFIHAKRRKKNRKIIHYSEVPFEFRTQTQYKHSERTPRNSKLQMLWHVLAASVV